MAALGNTYAPLGAVGARRFASSIKRCPSVNLFQGARRERTVKSNYGPGVSSLSPVPQGRSSYPPRTGGGTNAREPEGFSFHPELSPPKAAGVSRVAADILKRAEVKCTSGAPWGVSVLPLFVRGI